MPLESPQAATTEAHMLQLQGSLRKEISHMIQQSSFMPQLRPDAAKRKNLTKKTTRPKIVEDLTSSRPGASLPTHCNTSANDTPEELPHEL